MLDRPEKTLTSPEESQLKSGAKPYLVPFRAAVAHLGVETAIVPDTITVSRDQLREFAMALLRGVAFDEAAYLAMYPDVAEAITRGDITSARVHFIEYGYFEGRFPGPIRVDAEWYAAQYSDIAEGIEVGDFKSCQEHFDLHGRVEGRLPHPL